MALLKQKLAFKKVVKGSSITQAMKDVNYAPSTAARTNKLTSSKGWQELLEEYLPEKDLLRVAKEGLSATSVRFTPEGERIDVADFATRHKYVETGLKTRGKLQSNEGGNTTNILNIYSEEQLKRIAARVFNGESTSTEPSDRLRDSDKPTV